MASAKKNAPVARPVSELFLPENRSRLMSLIKGQGNKTTEEKLAVGLRRAGIVGWRRHLALQAARISPSPTRKYACSCTGASGTDVPAAMRPPPATRRSGGKRSLEIRRGTAASRILSVSGATRCSRSGNASFAAKRAPQASSESPTHCRAGAPTEVCENIEATGEFPKSGPLIRYPLP